MTSNPILGASIAFLLATVGASANSVQVDVPLDVSADYNFQLNGGGGGAEATLNGANVEILCADYFDNISLSTPYTADVTELGTSANLSDTRFGGVSGSAWTQFTTLGATDDTFFNSGAGSTALARYAMAAYLVSLYNESAGGDAANNEIQDAIWSIMDPVADGAVYDGGYSGTSYIEQAATWYMGMDTPGNMATLNTFLSHYEIVSDASMTFSNGLGIGGFQEQIIDPPTAPAPEPRGVAIAAIGLLGAGAFVLRKRRRSCVHGAN
jgi:hypothetical protein